jgi:hypothetical protein
MHSATPEPILNTSLPAQFRRIRIELAREPGHPEGDVSVGYVIIAPLDTDDRINPALWREHRGACRIARLRPDRQDNHGHLVHRQGGGWAFHYDSDANMPDEVGFHFADERFAFGEYVSINEGVRRDLPGRLCHSRHDRPQCHADCGRRVARLASSGRLRGNVNTKYWPDRNGHCHAGGVVEPAEEPHRATPVETRHHNSSVTLQIEWSTASVLTSKPSSRHICNMTKFS